MRRHRVCTSDSTFKAAGIMVEKRKHLYTECTHMRVWELWLESLGRKYRERRLQEWLRWSAGILQFLTIIFVNVNGILLLCMALARYYAGDFYDRHVRSLWRTAQLEYVPLVHVKLCSRLYITVSFFFFGRLGAALLREVLTYTRILYERGPTYGRRPGLTVLLLLACWL